MNQQYLQPSLTDPYFRLWASTVRRTFSLRCIFGNGMDAMISLTRTQIFSLFTKLM
jgi:hypothetical protein